LGGEDDAGGEAAEAFEERGGVAEAEGGEFVDQQEDFAVGWFSAGAVSDSGAPPLPGAAASRAYSVRV
jgi:hypothetical protein